MKRVVLLFIACVATLFASAETLAERLHANPDLLMLAYRAYIEPCEKIAPAPKGFRPCGAILYARHGSRYNIDTLDYYAAAKMLRVADEVGILTPLGKEVKSFVDSTKAVHGNHTHELSELGYTQHRNIARRMYRNFPTLFPRGAKVAGASSVVLRCIFSMNSFGEGLKDMEPSLRFSPRAGIAEQELTRPAWKPSSLATTSYTESVQYRTKGPWYDEMKEWESKQEYASSLEGLVTDLAQWRKISGCNDHDIAITIAKVLAFAHNYHTSGIALLQRFLTAEDMLKIYKHENFRWNHILINADHPIVAYNILRCSHMIKDIIANGNRAVTGEGDTQVHLRFTHDTFMIPLAMILGLEGFQGRNMTVEESINHLCMSDRLCMAMNIQFVVYRNKQGKALVRCLLNEQDLLLPIEGAEGPFYEWQAFCDHLRKGIDRVSRVLRR